MHWTQARSKTIRLHVSPNDLLAINLMPGGNTVSPAFFHIAGESSDRWDTLHHWLAEQSAPGTRLHVTLASALCRFWILPAGEEYLNHTAQTALAWQLFQQQFGPQDSRSWRLWLATRRFLETQLAIAVPTDLLAVLSSMAERAGIPIARIQPLFTAIWDGLPPRSRTPWLLLPEDDRCLLVQQRGGTIRQVQWRPAAQIPALLAQHHPEGIRNLAIIPETGRWLADLLPHLSDAEQATFRPCLWGLG